MVGVVVLGVALTQRISTAAAPTAAALLDEPAGTRIAGTAMANDRLTVQLTGAGPDRLVVIDLRTNRVLSRIALTR